MIASKNKLAVFDLDGTITQSDTYIEFIKYSRGRIMFYLGILFLSPFIIGFYLKFISNSGLKERFFSFYFKNQNYNKIIKDAKSFSINVIPNLCRPSALKILEWHRSQDHDILILSASAKLWLEKWCEKNQFELISSDFEVFGNKFTGKLKGENCFGKHKREALSKYISTKQYSYTFGYGDSKSDSYFLELVDESYLMELNDKNVHNYWKAPCG